MAAIENFGHNNNSDNEEFLDMPPLEQVPEPEEMFEEFIDEQLEGSYHPGTQPDQSKANHDLIRSMIHGYNSQQLEVFHRIFVRRNLLVTVEGPPRSGRTRTAAEYAALLIRLSPYQLTLVIVPNRRDAIHFTAAYHEIRTQRSPDSLLLLLDRNMEFNQLSRDVISIGNNTIEESREECTRPYQLAHLRAVATRIRQIHETLPRTANDTRILELIATYEKNITLHPIANISIDNLPEVACIINEVQVIVSTAEMLLRFLKISSTTMQTKSNTSTYIFLQALE